MVSNTDADATCDAAALALVRCGLRGDIRLALSMDTLATKHSARSQLTDTIEPMLKPRREDETDGALRQVYEDESKKREAKTGTKLDDIETGNCGTRDEKRWCGESRISIRSQT